MVTQIKTIDKQAMQHIRPVLEAALADIATQYGIEISLGNGRFSGESGTFKLNLATISEDGEVMTSEASDYKRLAELSYTDTKPEWLFQNFTQNGEVYQLLGEKMRARKRPMLIKRVSDGQIYNAPKIGVVNAFLAAG